MPSHAEPVAWISGRVESLAALFYLGAFLCFVRFRLVNRQAWLWATLLIFVAGLFAKQTIVTFPLLILAFDLIGPTAQHSARRPSFARLWPHVLFAVPVASYLALRYALFGNAVRENLLTAAALQEFLVRQNRYVRELLPTPNSAPRVMKVAAEVLTICVLAACGRWVLARRQAGCQQFAPRRLRGGQPQANAVPFGRAHHAAARWRELAGKEIADEFHARRLSESESTVRKDRG